MALINIALSLSCSIFVCLSLLLYLFCLPIRPGWRWKTGNLIARHNREVTIPLRGKLASSPGPWMASQTLSLFHVGYFCFDHFSPFFLLLFICRFVWLNSQIVRVEHKETTLKWKKLRKKKSRDAFTSIDLMEKSYNCRAPKLLIRNGADSWESCRGRERELSNWEGEEIEVTN